MTSNPHANNSTTAEIDIAVNWITNLDDNTLVLKLNAAILARDEADSDPGRIDEWLSLSQQIAAYRDELQRRAAERGGIVKDDRIVTFEGIAPGDVGNGQRLAARYGDVIRWCGPWNQWLVWDGRRWAVDETGVINRYAKETAKLIYIEAAHDPDDTKSKALGKWAQSSHHLTRLRAMVECAKSEPGIAIVPHELDPDPWLLNCLNGTIDLRTGQLREHQREDVLTKLAPIAYDPDAACPTFDAYLRRITNNRQELIDYIQRAVGYSLTGSTRERVLFILYGSGRNGKSTLLEIIRAILGDYAARTPTETLLVKRDGGIPNDIARLKGVRFVSASETEDGRRLAESLVKDLVGGDTISARFMRGEWFDFQPQFKIWLATNHKPVIRGTDPAIWDRIRLIPFEVRIPDEELDPELPNKLKAELPGILAWAVRGCLDWQVYGLGTSEAVNVATSAYRSEMDVIADWIDDCCVLAPHERVGATPLYESYKKWCEDNGERYVSQRKLAPQLKERGLFSDRSGANGSTVWHGITLKVSPVLNGSEPNLRISGLENPRKENTPKIGSEGSVAFEGSVVTARQWLESGVLASVPTPFTLGPGETIHDLERFARVNLTDATLGGYTGQAARERLIRLVHSVTPMIETEITA